MGDGRRNVVFDAERKATPVIGPTTAGRLGRRYIVELFVGTTTPFSVPAMPLPRPLAVVCVLFLGNEVLPAAETNAPGKSSFAAVEGATQKFFAGQAGYLPGDLISRKQVGQLLERLVRSGACRMTEDERADLLDHCLDERSFFFEQLGSPKGKLLLRKVSRIPGVYDILDRLSQMPQGRDLIQKLVRGPDGYKLLEYLLETKGGAELERMLEQAPKGRDLRRATGRIYAEAALLAELRKTFEAQQQRRAAARQTESGSGSEKTGRR